MEYGKIHRVPTILAPRVSELGEEHKELDNQSEFFLNGESKAISLAESDSQTHRNPSNSYPALGHNSIVLQAKSMKSIFRDTG